MQELSVRLRKFRSFNDSGVLPIRPLTFLVGENSAGKTSFLAALYYLFRFQEKDEALQINAGPFDLGSFDQISHQERGGFSTAPEFTLSMRKRVDLNQRRGLLRMLILDGPEAAGSTKSDWRDCDLDIVFGSVFGEATVIAVKLQLEEFQLNIDLYQSREITIVLPDGSSLQFQPDRGLAFDEYSRTLGFNNMRHVSFLLQGAALSWRHAPNHDESLDTKVSCLFKALSAVLNRLPDHVYASSPIRSIPERVYSSTGVGDTPDGKSTPYKLRRLKTASKSRWSRLHKGINQFGKQSGLYRGLDIGKLTSDSAGPFQVRVNTGHRRDNLADVGYGVSQTLPLIAELLEAPDQATFLFQQPEVHLHPRAQAGLGSFLANYISQHLNSAMVIETHSDYLIDRVRLEVRNGQVPSQALSILYFEMNKGETRVHAMEVDSDGEVVNPPECYRQFFLREQAALLGL